MDHLFALLKKYALPDLRPGYIRDFHDAVLAAVGDGKLTEEEIGKLEKQKEELGLSDDALSAIKQDLYLAAFNSIKEGQDVTEEEWDEMEHIQDYLGLADHEIGKTKKELYRMRIMSEIKQGNLPVMQSGNIVLDPQELLHWSEEVDILSGAQAKQSQPAALSFEGEKKLDSATVYITSKRLIVKGSEETASYLLAHFLGADCYINGALLHADKKKPITLRYREKGNHNVFGSVLLAAIAARKANG